MCWERTRTPCRESQTPAEPEPLLDNTWLTADDRLIEKPSRSRTWNARVIFFSTPIGVKCHDRDFLLNPCSESLKQLGEFLQAVLIELLVENGVQGDVSQLQEKRNLVQPEAVERVLLVVASHEVFQEPLGVGVFFLLLITAAQQPDRVIHGYGYITRKSLVRTVIEIKDRYPAAIDEEVAWMDIGVDQTVAVL